MLPNNPDSNPSIQSKDVHVAQFDYELDANAAFGEHIKNTYAICNADAYHTYGNVMGVVEKYLMDQFPPDTFKTVTGSKTLASKQMNHLPWQLHKKETPICVLVPRVMFGQDEDRFLANTLFNMRMNNVHSVWGDGLLIPLATDPHNKLYVHGHYNRAVMYIDVIMVFDTYGEQINWMSYLHNMFPIKHNQMLTTPLDLYLPNEMCQLISYVSHTPIRDESNSIYDFLMYMNTVWDGNITYKLRGGANRDDFFMNYLTDIDIVFQDPQLGQGQRTGNMHQNYEITFTIRCDFNTIGYFKIASPEIKHKIYVPESKHIIQSLYTDVFNLNDFKLPNGWKVLSWPIFKLDYGETSIDIDHILNDSLRATIDFHLQVNKSMDPFIRFQFRENGEIIDNELFYIDWHKRKLHILNPNYRRTYRMIISVCPSYINDMVAALYPSIAE